MTQELKARRTTSNSIRRVQSETHAKKKGTIHK